MKKIIFDINASECPNYKDNICTYNFEKCDTICEYGATLRKEQIEELKFELRCTKKWYKRLEKCYERQVASKEKLQAKLKIANNRIKQLEENK